jgi:hypothetical protein
MYTLFHKIQINKYIFTGSIEVSINKSYTTFTDTANIIIPNLLSKKTNENVSQTFSGDSLIKKGDPVKIWAGYDKPFNELPLIFVGFVSLAQADKNLTI